MVVFDVKRYAVREAEKWRYMYTVRKAKIERYAVRKGKGGVTLIYRVDSLFPLGTGDIYCIVIQYIQYI